MTDEGGGKESERRKQRENRMAADGIQQKLSCRVDRLVVRSTSEDNQEHGRTGKESGLSRRGRDSAMLGELNCYQLEQVMYGCKKENCEKSQNASSMCCEKYKRSPKCEHQHL